MYLDFAADSIIENVVQNMKGNGQEFWALLFVDIQFLLLF
jgi:hypothetical protein